MLTGAHGRPKSDHWTGSLSGLQPPYPRLTPSTRAHLSQLVYLLQFIVGILFIVPGAQRWPLVYGVRLLWLLGRQRPPGVVLMQVKFVRCDIRLLVLVILGVYIGR